MLVHAIGVEVHPLELDDSIGVHPLRWNLSVESELFDLDWPELIEILSCGRVEEHAYLRKIAEMILVLQNLQSLHLLVRLALLADLTILVLHFLRTVGHFYHNLLDFLHLERANAVHRAQVVLLLLLAAQPATMKHGVANMANIFLGFLTTFQSFLGPFVAFFFESVDEG